MTERELLAKLMLAAEAAGKDLPVTIVKKAKKARQEVRLQYYIKCKNIFSTYSYNSQKHTNWTLAGMYIRRYQEFSEVNASLPTKELFINRDFSLDAYRQTKRGFTDHKQVHVNQIEISDAAKVLFGSGEKG